MCFPLEKPPWFYVRPHNIKRKGLRLRTRGQNIILKFSAKVKKVDKLLLLLIDSLRRAAKHLESGYNLAETMEK